MTKRLAVIMDPINAINPKKDTTLGLLVAAQEQGWDLSYLELNDLLMIDGIAYGSARDIAVSLNNDSWFDFLTGPMVTELAEFDVILMRKDPPFDTEFIMATYVLDHAEQAGSVVVNRPSGLRDANEKFFTTWFSAYAPSTLITRDQNAIEAFHAEHGDIVLKPLDGMGGESVFRVTENDQNRSVIIETLTAHERRFIMAQQYIPEISAGDKRILIINGEPIPYALARIPKAGELRGNLAAGGRGEVRELTARDREICAALGPELRELGLTIVGIDVIGDWLTEINVTSPTGVREISEQSGMDVAGEIMTAIDEIWRTQLEEIE